MALACPTLILNFVSVGWQAPAASAKLSAYQTIAPATAPFGESAPSVAAQGRHLLVDYKGSDPVGSDTKGNGAGERLLCISEWTTCSSIHL